MKKILVVDDDVAIVEFLTECLRIANYQVESAFDGRQGCERAVALRPDLIILDLLMPDMHGFDVCQTLRKRGDMASTKILVSSGKGYAVDQKAAVRLGADGFLVKPYTADQLLAAVQKLVGTP